MTEYEVKLNNKVIDYVIYQSRKSESFVKSDLLKRGLSDKIGVKLHKDYGE